MQANVLASRMQDNKWKAALDRWSDDLSCALFALANVVTIMYYIVDTSTGVSRASSLSCGHSEVCAPSSGLTCPGSRCVAALRTFSHGSALQ